MPGLGSRPCHLPEGRNFYEQQQPREFLVIGQVVCAAEHGGHEAGALGNPPGLAQQGMPAKHHFVAGELQKSRRYLNGRKQGRISGKGLSRGSSSRAPVVVIAWRVVRASKVAAPHRCNYQAFPKKSFRRFSACNSFTEMTMGLLALMKALGAGVVIEDSGAGAGAAGRAASASVAGGAMSGNELAEAVGPSVTIVALAAEVATDVSAAVESGVKVVVAASCG